jgi:hypothetical protein
MLSPACRTQTTATEFHQKNTYIFIIGKGLGTQGRVRSF